MKDIKNEEKLNMLNHSCAHLLAHAVKNLYPNAKFWVGPVISEGFYYDLDLGDDVLREEDLPLISKEMKKLAKKDRRISRLELSKKEALKLFNNDKYKLELINNLPEEEIISVYKQDDFADLCRGPHVESTKVLKNFKLLSIAGAYYKGDSKNKMLQRIYGVCFENAEDLEEHLEFLEERKNNDHRKLNKELKLFGLYPEAGAGMAFWLPNGYALRKVLEDYSYNLQIANGYWFVSTPAVASKKLYEISGHWDHYQDNMFPLMVRDGEEFVLRPMSCPHHMLVYKSELRSYKDLPIRIAENVNQFRYEASGSLTGLERVRDMNLTDAHLFVREDQIKDEVERAYKLVSGAIKDLGLEIDYVELALHDPEDKEKFHDDTALWKKTETALRDILNEMKVNYVEMKGEAAFYGPKIDIQVKTMRGQVITMSTIQLDSLLPERFELTYVDKGGEKRRPVVIHRGLISTYERLVSILMEQYKGAFPTWLSPVQINLIPVNNEYHLEYSKQLMIELLNNNFRVKTDDRNEKLGYKMRESQMQKIPYSLIIGDKEKEEGKVSFRKYGEEETTTVSKEEFIKMIKNEVINKK